MVLLEVVGQDHFIRGVRQIRIEVTNVQYAGLKAISVVLAVQKSPVMVLMEVVGQDHFIRGYILVTNLPNT
jgi:hypothetical protein